MSNSYISKCCSVEVKHISGELEETVVQCPECKKIGLSETIIDSN